MMKKIIFSVALLVGLIGFVGFQPAELAYAQTDADASAAVCDALGSADTGACGASGGRQITRVIEVALNILSLVAGVIAVIMLVVSGLKFITSQGDSNSVSSARSGVIYALVGIIIVVFAQVLVRFVITQSTSVAPAPTASTPAPTSGVLE